MASNLSAASLREIVFQTNSPKRLVIKLKTAQLNSSDYRSSSTEYLSQIIPNFHSYPPIRSLATGIWTDRTFLVLDINIKEYTLKPHMTTEPSSRLYNPAV